MQKIKSKLHYLALLAALTLAACSDDDEPADSAIKKGYFEGTVSGTRQDGTAFSEPFRYEYVTNPVESGLETFHFNRSLTPSWDDAFMSIGFMGTSSNIQPLDAEFTFRKALSRNQLFSVIAKANFKLTGPLIRELSLAENQNTYHFSSSAGGNLYYQIYTYHDIASNKDIQTYMFQASIPSYYYVYYDAVTGELVAVYDKVTESVITAGNIFDLYDQLVFKKNTTSGLRVFHSAATGATLHEFAPEIPVDQFTMTNYTRNPSTGVVSFDFTVTINGVLDYFGMRENSTGHNLTITGKFNSGGEVYQEVIYGSK
jgi:hypothetical protein